MSSSVQRFDLDGHSTAESALAPTIEGLQLRSLEPRSDPRGAFTEIFSADWGQCVEPTQWSFVQSQAGVLRGMHLHRRHEEYFLLLFGKAWVGLHDIRRGSPTQGRSCLLELHGAEPTAVSFPRGIVHGWCFPEPSVHVQAVSETYARYGEDDNLGCHWSDPELEIPWPMRPTRVSPRADAFPSLRALIEETERIDPHFGY